MGMCCCILWFELFRRIRMKINFSGERYRYYILGFLTLGFFIKGKYLRTFIVSLALATTIELLQYIFCLGLCEIDDIIHNTIGAMIGCGYYGLIEMIWKRVINKYCCSVSWLFYPWELLRNMSIVNKKLDYIFGK